MVMEGAGTMPVITMLNQKGGVGKTSTCHHLAGTMALAGRRVLLIDNDPQASLTQGFWGPLAARQIDRAETVAALYAGDEPYPDQIIKPTGIASIDLVPGSKHATRFNVPMPHEADPAIQECMRDFLADVRHRYYPGKIDRHRVVTRIGWSRAASAVRFVRILVAGVI